MRKLHIISDNLQSLLNIAGKYAIQLRYND